MDTSKGAVVVGTDGSAGSQRAVDWAFRQAAAAGRPVHIVHTIDSMPAEFAPEMHREMSERGDAALEAAVQLRPTRADIAVSTEKVDGSAPRALLRASEYAYMVVVGSRGLGGFAELRLGSVSQHVARHARCPVAVVREQADPDAARVVVGVDAREVSAVAIRLAFDLADRCHQSLTALHAWNELAVGGAFSPHAPDVSEGAGSEGDLLRRATSQCRADHPGVDVGETVAKGHPARLLVAASKHASTVVVGSRGRGAFTGMLLGSTSQELLHHAHCPVIVAR